MVLLSQQFLFLKQNHMKRSLEIYFIVLVLIRTSFGMNVTLLLEGEKRTSEEENATTFLPITNLPKMLFGSLKWKFSTTDLYMARCNAEEDCDAGFRMICSNGRCVCKTGDLFFEWPKYGCFSKVPMFGPCEVSGQCAAMNPNTYCNPDTRHCTCSPNYYFDNNRECRIRYDSSNLKAQEVYKAAVVAAACFIVAVVGIFVACIVRRSFCRRDQNLHQSDSNRGSDVFSVSDEIAALRAVDKPPSYEEVLQIERTFYGIPPPEYSAPRSCSTLEPFTSSLNCVPSSPLNNPTEFQTPPQPHNSSFDATSNHELLKDSNTEASIHPHIDNIESDFLASVEVLVPPPGTALSVPVPVVETSHCTQYISSTPPPRLHRTCTKSTSLSSSLPGSPNLSSLHSTLRVLNLPTPPTNDLLKQNTTCPNQNTESCVIGSLNTELDTSVMGESSVNGVTNEQSDLAYDNLGFVPE